MISCPDCWPWKKPGYITMTQKKTTINGMAAQRLAPPQNIPSAKIRSKICRLDFLVWRRPYLHCLFSKEKGLSIRSITYLCWCKWRTIWRRMWREVHQVNLVLARQRPGLPGSCKPTWPSIFLITHSFLWIWTPRTTTCSLDWKNDWNVAIFRPTCRSLLPRRTGWTDILRNFFECLARDRATH